MEKDKKILIGGVGLLIAAGLAWLLIKRPPPDGGNGDGGTECQVDTDCPDDFVCVDGACIPM